MRVGHTERMLHKVMLDTIKQVPIFEWPGPLTKEPQDSPFRSTYTQTLESYQPGDAGGS